MPEATAKPLLLLVDGHSLAFRSFYAFSKGGEGGLATKDGRPTSVTYGFLKALLDNSKTLKPEGVAIAFDTEVHIYRTFVYNDFCACYFYANTLRSIFHYINLVLSPPSPTRFFFS